MEIDMSNYVQQMWDSQPYEMRHTSKSAAIAAWVIGVLAVGSIAAFATQAYWMPYVSPYLAR